MKEGWYEAMAGIMSLFRDKGINHRWNGGLLPGEDEFAEKYGLAYGEEAARMGEETHRRFVQLMHKEFIIGYAMGASYEAAIGKRTRKSNVQTTSGG
jgi:hypothetical protein